MRLLKTFHETSLSEEELIVMMLQDRISGLEISKTLNVKYSQVNILRKKYNLLSENKTFQRTIFEENTMRCLICEKINLIDDFPARIGNGKKLYALSYCYECEKVSLNNPLEKNSLAKKLARKEKATRNNNNIPVTDLPYGYYAFLFLLQEGKCFYTGKDLLFNKDPHSTISVDRVIFNKPYQQGNIVYCINRINRIKLNLTLKEIEKWSPKLDSKIKLFYENQDKFMMNPNGKEFDNA